MNYQDFVDSRCKEGDEVIAGMDGGKAHLAHMALGLSGEAGEVVDIIKKHAIYGKPLDRAHLVEEIGDTLFYIAGICNDINVSFATVMELNMQKLSKRYPEGKYSDKQAQERADK